MLAGAWGVRIDLKPDQVDRIKDYVSKVSGTKVLLDSGETVNVLKADIKERKGEATLIFRYQLVS